MLGLALGIVLIFVLFLAGAPIYAAFGLGSILVIGFVYNIPWLDIPTIMFQFLQSYTLLACPLFILAGNLLIESGGVRKGMAFFDAWIGHVPGGLFAVVVLFCTFFAACTGSNEAAIVAVGGIMFPEMIKHVYSRGFSAGAIISASMLAPIIPPSLTAIVMASLMELSTASLFACGLIPGLIISALYLIVGMTICKIKGTPVKERSNWRTRGSTLVKALPVSTVPVIILGGIYGGFVTPTEAATLCCVVALILGLVYRGFTWQKLWHAIVNSAKLNAGIYMLMAGIAPFAYLLHISGGPAALAEFAVAAGITPFAFVILSTAFFFIAGFFTPPWATMIMMTPIMLPILNVFGINLYWYTTIWRLNITGAGCTPPFAYSIFIGVRALNTPFDEIVKGILPFLPLFYLAMIGVIFYPELALWLPRIMGLPVGA